MISITINLLQYSSIPDFLTDIRKMFWNCKKFHRKGSQFVAHANKLEDHLDKILQVDEFYEFMKLQGLYVYFILQIGNIICIAPLYLQEWLPQHAYEEYEPEPVASGSNDNTSSSNKTRR